MDFQYFEQDRILEFAEMVMFLLMHVSECDNKLVVVQSF